MKKQLTAILLLVAGTTAGNALANCRSCDTSKPKCCYTKEICRPAKKKAVYEYHCDKGSMKHKNEKAQKPEHASARKVKNYSNGNSKNGHSKHMNKNGNRKNK